MTRPAAVASPNPQLAGAIAAWDALPLPDKRRLAYEVASTRSEELRLAYPSLVSIGHGFKMRGETPAPPATRTRSANRPAANQRKRKSTTRPTPTGTVAQDEVVVVLTVARKWRESPTSRRRTRQGRLPKHLLAYWSTKDPDGRESRTLCAVPTDVRCGTILRTARPRSTQVRVDDNGPVTDQKGMIAFAVKLDGKDPVYGLSCHHVLAMSTRTSPPGTPAPTAVTYLRNPDATNGNRIGPLHHDWIGQLTNRPGELSLDAALCAPATPDELAALREALAGVNPSFTVKSPDAVPTLCRFVLANNRTLPGRFVAEHLTFDGIGYFPPNVNQPIQPGVLEFQIQGNRSTQGGDSGCPVLSEDGDVLVGMHLGGIDRTTTVFVLPAYEILNPLRWGRPDGSIRRVPIP